MDQKLFLLAITGDTFRSVDLRGRIVDATTTEPQCRQLRDWSLMLNRLELPDELLHPPLQPAHPKAPGFVQSFLISPFVMRDSVAGNYGTGAILAAQTMDVNRAGLCFKQLQNLTDLLRTRFRNCTHRLVDVANTKFLHYGFLTAVHSGPQIDHGFD